VWRGLRAIPRLLRAVWANPVHRFAIGFVACLAAVGFGYPPLRRRYYLYFAALERGTAKLEYLMMSLVSSQAKLDEDVVSYAGFSVHIVEECTGVYEALIFASAVLAYPTRWRHKLVGLLAGIPAIYAFNLVRIASLLVIGRYQRQLFDFVHLYFWQGTLILLVSSCWLAWLLLVVRRDEAAAPLS
jgi:exosortase H (IPTLxxWG-CTERM-specific)